MTINVVNKIYWAIYFCVYTQLHDEGVISTCTKYVTNGLTKNITDSGHNTENDKLEVHNNIITMARMASLNSHGCTVLLSIVEFARVISVTCLLW